MNILNLFTKGIFLLGVTTIGYTVIRPLTETYTDMAFQESELAMNTKEQSASTILEANNYAKDSLSSANVNKHSRRIRSAYNPQENFRNRYFLFSTPQYINTRLNKLYSGLLKSIEIPESQTAINTGPYRGYSQDNSLHGKVATIPKLFGFACLTPVNKEIYSIIAHNILSNPSRSEKLRKKNTVYLTDISEKISESLKNLRTFQDLLGKEKTTLESLEKSAQSIIFFSQIKSYSELMKTLYSYRLSELYNAVKVAETTGTITRKNTDRKTMYKPEKLSYEEVISRYKLMARFDTHFADDIEDVRYVQLLAYNMHIQVDYMANHINEIAVSFSLPEQDNTQCSEISKRAISLRKQNLLAILQASRLNPYYLDYDTLNKIKQEMKRSVAQFSDIVAMFFNIFTSHLKKIVDTSSPVEVSTSILAKRKQGDTLVQSVIREQLKIVDKELHFMQMSINELIQMNSYVDQSEESYDKMEKTYREGTAAEKLLKDMTSIVKLRLADVERREAAQKKSCSYETNGRTPLPTRESPPKVTHPEAKVNTTPKTIVATQDSGRRISWEQEILRSFDSFIASRDSETVDINTLSSHIDLLKKSLELARIQLSKSSERSPESILQPENSLLLSPKSQEGILKKIEMQKDSISNKIETKQKIKNEISNLEKKVAENTENTLTFNKKSKETEIQNKKKKENDLKIKKEALQKKKTQKDGLVEDIAHLNTTLLSTAEKNSILTKIIDEQELKAKQLERELGETLQEEKELVANTTQTLNIKKRLLVHYRKRQKRLRRNTSMKYRK